MEIQLLANPADNVVEFRGVKSGKFLGKDTIYFQLVVPITSLHETEKGVFRSDNTILTIGPHFFHMEEGDREFHAPMIVGNDITLISALQTLISPNPSPTPDEDPLRSDFQKHIQKSK